MIIKNTDSLEKIYPDKSPERRIEKAVILADERYNYQIAIYSETNFFCEFEIDSDISDSIIVRKVDSVYSEFPIYPDHDENIISDKPGMFPDLLSETPGNIIYGPAGWSSLWITVCAEKSEIGSHYISLRLKDPFRGEILECGEKLTVNILPEKLNGNKLICTDWLHTDCLAEYYNTEVFSTEYWRITENFVKSASKHGINMMLTPVFTPPLDTKRGGERLTVQLVEVYKKENKYTFDFSNLQKWIDMCLRSGIIYFEISHLFTQWGAGAAPKIMADENGNYHRIFGWDTPSDSPEYTDFLNSFLPQLVTFLLDNGLAGKVYFHVSDEPQTEHIDSYKKAVNIVKNHINGKFKTLDALSDYDYYKKGLVDIPVPSSNHLEEFYTRGTQELWTYYCCAQYKGLSNRFMCMPSYRNRIIGIQMYLYGVKGFLHWGYNFYNTQNSFMKVNPYVTTAAGATFPSGDAFCVYPGSDGTALCSLRLEVFNDAVSDYNALLALEAKIGREAVVGLIHQNLGYKISMTEYPRSGEWIIKLREKINLMINGQV